MNDEGLKFPGKRKSNAALKDNIDRFRNCSGKFTISPDEICKCSNEITRKEQFNLLNSAPKIVFI